MEILSWNILQYIYEYKIKFYLGYICDISNLKNILFRNLHINFRKTGGRT